VAIDVSVAFHLREAILVNESAFLRLDDLAAHRASDRLRFPEEHGCLKRSVIQTLQFVDPMTRLRSQKSVGFLCIALAVVAAVVSVDASNVVSVLTPLWIVLPAIIATIVRRNTARCDEQPVAFRSLVLSRAPADCRLHGWAEATAVPHPLPFAIGATDASGIASAGFADRRLATSVVTALKKSARFSVARTEMGTGNANRFEQNRRNVGQRSR
jgi:hypothetical protein